MQSEIKGKIRVGIMVGLFALIIVAVIGLVFFFMYAGIFSLLGIRYDSWQSIVVFLLLAVVFDAVMSVIQLLPRTFGLHRLDSMPAAQAALLLSAVQIVLDFVSVHTIDELERSVEIPTGSELLVVLIVFTVDRLLRFGGRKPSGARTEPDAANGR